MGRDHVMLFRFEVGLEGRPLGVGEGPSRRTAETAAATRALEALRRERAAASGPSGTAGGGGAGARNEGTRGRNRATDGGTRENSTSGAAPPGGTPRTPRRA